MTAIILTKLAVRIIFSRQQSLGEGAIGQDCQANLSTKRENLGFRNVCQ